MICETNKRYVFMIFILNRMLYLCAADGEENSYHAIFLDTKYIDEEYNLTWRIANYSQIFDYSRVYARFSLDKSSTKWMLRLFAKAHIRLHRYDDGEAVNVNLKYSLQTPNGIFAEEKSEIFHDDRPYILLDLEKLDFGKSNHTNEKVKRNLIEFENDVLYFNCTMRVVGPISTKTSMN